MPKADLGAVFAPAALAPKQPADRAAGLRGLKLNPPAPTDPQSRIRSVQPAPPADPASCAEVSREVVFDSATVLGPGTGPAVVPVPQAAVAASVVVPITVYLPVSLRDRLNAHRRAVGQTLTAVVLDAVEAAHQDLDVLLAAYRPAAGAGLFAHRPAPLITRDEPNVQVGLRPSRADLAVLDELVERHHAPNRSVLVTVALDSHITRG
jgi:hypothetical protein